jgi:hypothetical protein
MGSKKSGSDGMPSLFTDHRGSQISLFLIQTQEIGIEFERERRVPQETRLVTAFVILCSQHPAQMILDISRK